MTIIRRAHPEYNEIELLMRVDGELEKRRVALTRATFADVHCLGELEWEEGDGDVTSVIIEEEDARVIVMRLVEQMRYNGILPAAWVTALEEAPL